MNQQRHASGLSTAALLDMYSMMLRIRMFEERVAELVQAKEIACPTHLCIGQEACAVGVIAALRPDDYVLGAHRSHGHYIAKVRELKRIMAEIFCRRDGCSKGRGGSMHLIAPESRFMGSVPIVGATIPIAVGFALASQYRGDGRITVSFFGDGAVEEGVFHESLNFASLRRLPVVFAVENNFYSSHLRLEERQPADNIADKARAYMIPGVRVDGNDVLAVYESARQAVERARTGLGPTLLELRTYRWRGHVGPSYDLDVGIRTKQELEEWMARCPIARLESILMQRGDLTAGMKEQIMAQLRAEISEAEEFARKSPPPDPGTLYSHVYK